MLCPANLLGYLRAPASWKWAPPVECGSLLPPSAARAPRVLLAFTYSRAVIPSGVSGVLPFARCVRGAQKGLPGRRLVEPGRSVVEESLFDVTPPAVPIFVAPFGGTPISFPTANAWASVRV
jgi:hypothetical protein